MVNDVDVPSPLDLLCKIVAPDRTKHLDGAQIRRPGLLQPQWAMVLGGSVSVWDEVLVWEKLYGRQWDGLIVAANDIGCHWPRDLDHWVTLHATKMPAWEKQRAAYGFPAGYVTWGRRHYDLQARVQPWAGGCSGMLAVQVARWLQCRKVVLCGLPMTATPHFAESLLHDPSKEWPEVGGHWRAWRRHLNKMRGLVRSMSGRTAEALGTPTVNWLKGDN